MTIDVEDSLGSLADAAERLLADLGPAGDDPWRTTAARLSGSVIGKKARRTGCR